MVMFGKINLKFEKIKIWKNKRKKETKTHYYKGVIILSNKKRTSPIPQKLNKLELKK